MPEILVVDDSKAMRDMITACLRPDPGIAVTEASSGLAGLATPVTRAPSPRSHSSS